MTTNVWSLFDQYSLKARLYPAFLTAFPVVVMVVMLWQHSPLASLWPLVIGVGGLFFLASWVRGRGQDVEKRLVKTWDGMPTTHMLRLSEADNRPSFTRRRRLLTELTGVDLPSQAKEARDSARADDAYITATRALIARVRAKEDLFPRVQDENTHYGFWRNLYALKPIAISILVAAILFDVAWVIFARPTSAAALVTVAVHILTFCAWIFVVKPGRVRKQADTYAERLFEALEDPRLSANQ